MNFETSLQERGRHLWAKSAKEGVGHSLLAHLLDVGLVAEKLLAFEGDITTEAVAVELGLSVPEARNLIVLLAALHDIGKATPVFQAKWPPGAPPEAFRLKAPDLMHGRASGILLKARLVDRAVHPRLASSLANAVAIHHGQRLPPDFAKPGTYDPRSLGEDENPWPSWRIALMEDVEIALGELPRLSTKHYLKGRTWGWLAGVTSVADWLGSSLPHVGTISDVGAYVATRREEVARKLKEVAWPETRPWWRPPEPPASFSSWFSVPDSEFVPRPLQEAVGELVRDQAEPMLLIVEAPMGEGKTEAAFFAMVQPIGERGAYFALPTQATSDAMHDRLTVFVDRHRLRSVDVALAHGASKALRLFDDQLDQVDASGTESRSQAESWFSMGRRELLAELGAGTVDQALLGVLPVRHFFVRLWGLAGKVVIFDEVHAYDAYTGGLIAELLKWLASVGTSVVLMSATLPSATKRQLIQAYSSGLGVEPRTVREAAYPRLASVSRVIAEERHFEASRKAEIELLDVPYDLAALSEELLAASQQDGAVVAVVNTVDRAQRLYAMCKQLGAEAVLLHARMPLDERKRREKSVVARFGPHGTQGGRDGLVIATQVVEQSLDLDFDVMYSDLAPVDLLLQRIGRVHRHDRDDRPMHFRTPKLHIAGIRGEEVQGPALDAVDTVYDKLIMWRTWAVLSGRAAIRLPEDIDDLVQLVYGDAALPGLESFADIAAEAKAEFELRKAAATQAARDWSLSDPLGPSAESWGSPGRDEDDPRTYTLRLPTRLGEDSVIAIPLAVAGTRVSVFGSEVVVGMGSSRVGEAFVMQALSRQIRVSRKSLVVKLRSQQVPTWWERAGGLKHNYPLFLDESGRAFIDRTVLLDSELGLVYGKGE